MGEVGDEFGFFWSGLVFVDVVGNTEVAVFFEVVDVEVAGVEAALLGLRGAGREWGDEVFGDGDLCCGSVEESGAIGGEVEVGGRSGDYLKHLAW